MIRRMSESNVLCSRAMSLLLSVRPTKTTVACANAGSSSGMVVEDRTGAVVVVVVVVVVVLAVDGLLGLLGLVNEDADAVVVESGTRAGVVVDVSSEADALVLSVVTTSVVDSTSSVVDDSADADAVAVGGAMVADVDGVGATVVDVTTVDVEVTDGVAPTVDTVTVKLTCAVQSADRHSRNRRAPSSSCTDTPR